MLNRFRKLYRTILMFANKMPITMYNFAKNGKNYCISSFGQNLVTIILALASTNSET